MVKSTVILAASLTIASSLVVAQDQIPTALPSGITLPSTVPTEVPAAISSLLANPAGLQSYISAASNQVGQLPTQYQASLYSALAAASKTLDSLPSSSNQAPTSAGNACYKPTNIAALVLGAAFVIGIMM